MISVKLSQPAKIDVSDATAVAGNVLSPKTFYAGEDPAIKVGTMDARTLSPDNENVLEGFYEATLLSTVDVDLVTGNIKAGVTIFGKAGDNAVRDISDADALIAQVQAGVTFYSVSGARKTGTLPTQSLSPASANVAAGYYAMTTLDAVDADLAAANIVDGITIFGVEGTHECPNPDSDLHEIDNVPGDTDALNWGEVSAVTADWVTLLTVPITPSAGSTIVCFAGGAVGKITDNCALRLAIDGVQVGSIETVSGLRTTCKIMGAKDDCLNQEYDVTLDVKSNDGAVSFNHTGIYVGVWTVEPGS